MTTTIPRRPARAIDVHAHLTIPEVYAITLPHSLVAIPLDAAAPQTDAVRAENAERRRVMDHDMSDITNRLQRMDQMGVAVQVLTASLVHQATDMLPLEESVRLERIKNDRMSAIVKTAPRRYVGLGGVPRLCGRPSYGKCSMACVNARIPAISAFSERRMSSPPHRPCR